MIKMTTRCHVKRRHLSQEQFIHSSSLTRQYSYTIQAVSTSEPT